jgi:acetate kinase
VDPVVLTFNAGSSSLKVAVYDFVKTGALKSLAAGEIEGIGEPSEAKGLIKTASGETAKIAFDPSKGRVDHQAAMRAVLDWLKASGHGDAVAAVGHRIVHGGPEFIKPAVIDDDVLAKLTALIPLAPLHQPHNIAGVKAALKAFPSAPQVACFDTAFHRSHPFVSDTYALPRSFYDDGVRRYGFHGLSYESILHKLPALAPGLADKRLIVGHLGNGASMCAIRAGRSIASTMGFTALDGLPMGTRCGQIDPGVLLYLLAEKSMTGDQISDLLYKNSGLKGMSGLSQDMRELEASSDERAREAIAYFVERVRREIGGLAAALEGVDAIIFTGGIGEHAWKVREEVLARMDWMGVRLDPDANRASALLISAKDSPIAVFVIQTDEERMIAEHTVATAGLRRG